MQFIKRMSISLNKEEQISQLRENKNLSIKNFKVEELLGDGCSCTVHKVLYTYKGQQTAYAVKKVKKTDLKGPLAQCNFNREISILEMIEHPFIVRFITKFEDQEYHYLLFEYLGGSDFRTVLQENGKLKAYQVKFYMAQLLLALRYLHISDVIYRDIKPENIVLDEQNYIRLVDFGLSKVSAKNRTFTLCGTPEYIAPELILNKEDGYGNSVDWWAFGIVIYELLVG